MIEVGSLTILSDMKSFFQNAFWEKKCLVLLVTRHLCKPHHGVAGNDHTPCSCHRVWKLAGLQCWQHKFS